MFSTSARPRPWARTPTDQRHTTALGTRLRFLGLGCAAVVLLAACGGGSEGSAGDSEASGADPKDGAAGAATTPAEPTPTPAPTGAVQVPESVELTAPGAKLAFGEAATVAYAADAKRNSVLKLQVAAASQGKISDLAAYQLDPQTSTATPYYVRVGVHNVGAGELGGSAVPVWAVDSRNTLVQASSFTNNFAQCPSQPLPKTFGKDAKLNTCLVYLLPKGTKLMQLSYRPVQKYAGITWTGNVAPAAKKAQ